MENTTKALYNSLRLHIAQVPASTRVEPWKVEDLRLLKSEELFERLNEKGIFLDKQTFIAYANEYDTPEELGQAVLTDESSENEVQDYIYLHVFELWRRFVPEKLTVSLITDELDYQIYLYDTEALQTLESLDDAISGFYEVLEENVDFGIAPLDAFHAICEYTAHDIFAFLYDYISELIELEQYEYAQDLIERFFPFVEGKKWFEFLHAQIIASKEPRRGLAQIKKIAQENYKNCDRGLFLDMLTFLLYVSQPELFCFIAKALLEQDLDDDDVEELTCISKEFFQVQGSPQQQQIAAMDEQNKKEQVVLLRKLYSAL